MKYILGLSGGVDSCYALHLAKDLDIVAVSFDNGWDTEIAKNNAKNICCQLDIKHKVYSCDLNEFREIQRAFLLSSTMHAECPSDVAIKKTMLTAMKEFNADCIISGDNKWEGSPPAEWSVVDGLYVKDVMKKHGRVKLKTFPNMTFLDHLKFRNKTYKILDTIDYDPIKAKEELKRIYGWEDYKVKHHENLYTKFNQGLRYWKFGIDMRTIEMKHDYDLTKPPYNYEEFVDLGADICSKLDLHLGAILHSKPRDWKTYRSYRRWILRLKSILGK